MPRRRALRADNRLTERTKRDWLSAIRYEDLEMPPLSARDKFPALTDEEIVRLRTWVQQGAIWPDGVVLQD